MGEKKHLVTNRKLEQGFYYHSYLLHGIYVEQVYLRQQN
jgi:hypothetical protein